MAILSMEIRSVAVPSSLAVRSRVVAASAAFGAAHRFAGGVGAPPMTRPHVRSGACREPPFSLDLLAPGEGREDLVELGEGDLAAREVVQHRAQPLAHGAEREVELVCRVVERRAPAIRQIEQRLRESLRLRGAGLVAAALALRVLRVAVVGVACRELGANQLARQPRATRGLAQQGLLLPLVPADLESPHAELVVVVCAR
eukprot:scaffold114192_cov66-Phaeocystis_antarctica.AAC.2